MSTQQQQINVDPTRFQPIKDIYDIYGPKGLAVLAWWHGALFAKEIREKQDSYPFLLLTGAESSGKEELLEFLWRLYRRPEYVGFNINRATRAAAYRHLFASENGPVVFLSSDCLSVGSRSLNYDGFISAYSGGLKHIRTVRKPSGGSQTQEYKFNGAILFASNSDFDPSPEILARSVWLELPESRAYSKQSLHDDHTLKKFLPRARGLQKKSLWAFCESQNTYQSHISGRCGVINSNIIKNYSQLMALITALGAVFNIPQVCAEESLEKVFYSSITHQQVLDGKK